MKKLFDICSSLFAVFIFSPILIVTSIAIKLESKGPIVFKQKRPGIDNKIFNIYKLYVQGLPLSTWGVVRMKLCFQLPELTKASQARQN